MKMRLSGSFFSRQDAKTPRVKELPLFACFAALRPRLWRGYPDLDPATAIFRPERTTPCMPSSCRLHRHFCFSAGRSTLPGSYSGAPTFQRSLFAPRSTSRRFCILRRGATGILPALNVLQASSPASDHPVRPVIVSEISPLRSLRHCVCPFLFQGTVS